MKKLIRAVLLVFLSMVLMFASVTSVWGDGYAPPDDIFETLPYPVPNELKEDRGFAHEWYNNSYELGRDPYWKTVEPYALLWFRYTPFSDNECWDEAFFRYFEECMAKEDYFSERDRCTANLHDFSWEGRTLIADVSIDYNIKHEFWNSSPIAGPEFGQYISNFDKSTNGLAIFITEKETGKIVDMGRVGEVYLPKFADWYKRPYIDAREVVLPVEEMEYTSNVRKVTEIKMHIGFDPALHDVTVGVVEFISLGLRLTDYDMRYEYPVYIAKVKSFPIDTTECHMPTGDMDGNGITNLRDISAILRHIADWEIEGFNATEADLDGDGVVNLSDAQIGMKIACGWDLTK